LLIFIATATRIVVGRKREERFAEMRLMRLRTPANRVALLAAVRIESTAARDPGVVDEVRALRPDCASRSRESFTASRFFTAETDASC